MEKHPETVKEPQEIKILSEFHLQNPDKPKTWDEWMKWFEQRYKEGMSEPREIELMFHTNESWKMYQELLKEEFNLNGKRTKTSTKKDKARK